MENFKPDYGKLTKKQLKNNSTSYTLACFEPGTRKVKSLTLNTGKLTEEEIAKSLREFSETCSKAVISEEPQLTAELVQLDGLDLNLDPKTGNTTVIFGSSKAGKSTTLMYIYNKYYRNDFISVLFSENSHISLYKDSKLITSPYFFSKVVMNMHKINRKTKNHYNFCALLDDIVDEKENTTIRKMILTYRNANVSSVISAHGMSLVQKSNRGSINNVLFFKFNTDEQILLAVKTYLMALPGKRIEDKVEIYKKMTNDHGFIYLDTRNQTISYHKLII